jgi:hypothetical protein
MTRNAPKRMAIYHEIVGNVYSKRFDIDAGLCVELFVEVTPYGPEVVGNQVWIYEGSDDLVTVKWRPTIDPEVRRKRDVSHSHFVQNTLGLRREFVDQTDGEVHTRLTAIGRGYGGKVTIEMTRFRPLINLETVFSLADI